jgi:hypothetical protein
VEKFPSNQAQDIVLVAPKGQAQYHRIVKKKEHDFTEF